MNDKLKNLLNGDNLLEITDELIEKLILENKISKKEDALSLKKIGMKWNVATNSFVSPTIRF